MTQLVCALQCDTAQKAKKIYAKTKGWVDVYKIGIDLFVHSGMRLVNQFIKAGEEIFLDLKLCDIPTVVSRTAETIAKAKVKMFTIHTMGGYEMMKLCREHLLEYCEKKHIKKRPLIIGVTILTSISELDFSNLWNTKNMELSSHILRLASLAKKAGIDGVVCSAHEIKMIKKECGPDFLTIVPGIRLSSPKTDLDKKPLQADEERTKLLIEDQKRAASAEQAARFGADYIVVGRPILRAEDPISVIEQIQTEIKKGWQNQER
ncbi:MAG: orotidine-5'-phosphate decarboxylase [candidate division WOR-3 bacterium]